jgi:hypothetical protein
MPFRKRVLHSGSDNGDGGREMNVGCTGKMSPMVGEFRKYDRRADSGYGAGVRPFWDVARGSNRRESAVAARTAARVLRRRLVMYRASAWASMFRGGPGGVPKGAIPLAISRSSPCVCSRSIACRIPVHIDAMM